MGTSFLKFNRLQGFIGACIAGILLLPAVAATASPVELLTLGNGVTVTLYTPELIIMELTERDDNGALYMRLPGELLRYRLVEDIGDEVIVNKGDGSFHPIETDYVLEALEAIDVAGGMLDHAIEVYILPYPRYYPLTSSASGNRIFLSPGVFEVNPYVAAYTVTHEYGHTYQHHYMPDDDTESWYRYLTLRGIYQDPTYTSTAEHMFRPKEVFAEDFRYLFGGDEARYTGTIENTELVPPTLVPGLESFMVALAGVAEEGIVTAFPGRSPLAVTNHPNPFNPATVITLTFGADVADGERRVDIKLYGVDGRFVKTLYSGAVIGDQLSMVWNGTDDRGAPVTSGIYFYRAVSNVGTVTGKMLLMR
jgi:hypothetical protein